MSIITIVLGVTCLSIGILVDRAVKDASKTIQSLAVKNFVAYKKR